MHLGVTQVESEFRCFDELGYVSFSRVGAELLFQLFADRYERPSLLITSNLAFGGPTSILIQLPGVSAIDQTGKSLDDPAALKAL